MADSLSSVDNALRLVQILGERPELGVAEAGRLLGVARSTAHRLLTSLVMHGFASQDPDRRTYSAGPALAQAGLAVIERYDVRGRAKPYLEAVSEQTGETTHLIVLAGALALFIDGVEGRHPVRTAPRLGTSMPAHIASGGKALLAELTPTALRSLYPKGDATLTRELERIRAQGYALNVGGWDTQINAVSVAVRDQNGIARFAVGVSSPAFRAGEDAMRDLGDTLLDLCGRQRPAVPSTADTAAMPPTRSSNSSE